MSIEDTPVMTEISFLSSFILQPFCIVPHDYIQFNEGAIAATLSSKSTVLLFGIWIESDMLVEASGLILFLSMSVIVLFSTKFKFSMTQAVATPSSKSKLESTVLFFGL